MLQSARQALARLSQQVDGRRSQKQESAGAFATATSGVDQPAKIPEQLRRAMDLVDDDEAIRIPPEKERRISEPRPIGARLEIEIEGTIRLGDLVSKGSFPYLSGAEQRHRCLPGQAGPHIPGCTSSYHACKLKRSVWICKDSCAYACTAWRALWPAGNREPLVLRLRCRLRQRPMGRHDGGHQTPNGCLAQTARTGSAGPVAHPMRRASRACALRTVH